MKATKHKLPANYHPWQFRKEIKVTDCPVCGGSGWRKAGGGLAPMPIYCSRACNKKATYMRASRSHTRAWHEMEKRIAAAHEKAKIAYETRKAMAAVDHEVKELNTK